MLMRILSDMVNNNFSSRDKSREKLYFMWKHVKTTFMAKWVIYQIVKDPLAYFAMNKKSIHKFFFIKTWFLEIFY